MDTEKLLDCEAKKLRKFSFLLPHVFQKISIVGLVLSIIALFSYKLMATDVASYKLVTKYCILIFAFILSISKEKIEDELSVQLRTQSFSIGFVFGVFFAIILPFVGYGSKLIFSPDNAVFHDYDSFTTVIMMLFMHLGSYYGLKMTR